MDKMKMSSPDLTVANIEKIAELFPNVITEAKDEQGNLVHKVDFEKLKQELSADVIDGDESYDFTWVGKKQAMVEANKPTNKTLRPCLDESVNWEKTENLYIEGDNLEVLKLLQESYLNKVKMIYIDPPYNTGNDSLTYSDNFVLEENDYNEKANFINGDGFKTFKNTETNGRFHSDWCSMIYRVLKLSRNLLTDDGIIFISIDDNEVDNLKKICDEIFGRENFIADLIRKTKSQTNDAKTGVNYQHEFLLVFAKNKSNIFLRGENKDFSNYKNSDNDPAGAWVSDNPSARSGGPNSSFPITNPYTGTIDYPPQGRYWAFAQSTFDEWVKIGKVKFREHIKEGERGFIIKKYLSEVKSSTKLVDSLFGIDNTFMNQVATKELNVLFKEASFIYPKPLNFIRKIVEMSANQDSLILDFFSGSATTAHAVMQLNAEDGGSRKFIMVQLPEVCDEKSEAYKTGYKNICEIGKERIRRAGKKIVEETGKTDLDIGFRVLKLDESNMKNVYYTPDELSQSDLVEALNNIKDGRSGYDLLYQCMLDWGLELSLPHETVKINNNEVHIVNGCDLIVCFDDKVSEDTIKQIADKKPLRAVFRDSSFATPAARINVDEIFKLKSPHTTIKVL